MVVVTPWPNGRGERHTPFGFYDNGLKDFPCSWQRTGQY
jgi:hypothetical protein